jgi:hypothetical protein
VIEFSFAPGSLNFRPYTWDMVHEEGQDVPWIVCPRCVQRFSLRDRQVLGNGMLQGIVGCPYTDCRWTEFVRLGGWKTRAKVHGIIYLLPPTVECRCGWRYQLPDPREWGNVAAKDKLLDAHIEHRQGLEERGL